MKAIAANAESSIRFSLLLSNFMVDKDPVASRATPPKPTHVGEPRWIGVGLCVLSAASYGSISILGKLGYANGLMLSNMLSFRFGGAAIALFAYLALTQRRVIYPGAWLNNLQL